MEIYHRPRKIRIIQQSSRNLPPTYGVVLPQNFKTWVGVYVTVSESGGQIILHSGALPTPMSKTQFRIITKTIDVVNI